MTTTTTRVVLPGLVEPAGLIVETAPIGSPGKGQLLVAVEATGISFAEQSMRRGRYFGQPKFPFVPGYDLVGTVQEVGPGGDRSLIGKRVATITKTGGWASHVLVKARDSVLVPAGLDPAEVEAIVVNGITAWQMLYRSAQVKPGQTILVHGASGAVGGILIQLAHRAGITVIGGASPRHHDALRAAGVEPIDYNAPDFADQVRKLAPGGVDAVFDNVGGPMTHVSYSLLAPGGALVCYSIIKAVEGTGGLMMPFMKALGRLLLWDVLPNGHRATFYNIWADHTARPARFRRHLEEDLGHVFALLADGTLKPTIAARFPLAEASAAMTLAESRTVGGKVILLP